MKSDALIDRLEKIAARRPRGVRLMAMDIGKKTIGLALSDPGQGIATPLKTIMRTKFTKDIEQLRPIIREYEVGGYILGYPLNMDGSEGPRCESVRHFAQEMANYPQIFGTDLWIGLWDERLSTAAVEDFLVNQRDMSREKRDKIVDSLAAQTILAGALDYFQNENSTPKLD